MPNKKTDKDEKYDEWIETPFSVKRFIIAVTIAIILATIAGIYVLSLPPIGV